VAASGFCGVWAGPIAGKPAPTGFSVDLKMFEQQKYCGSWLASDGARGFKEDISLLYG
jgi:bacillopeptidase F (M6 metalloprotease family)